MIDIHSHILAGMDDGAKTIEDSIDIARAAVREGITKIAATPHHKNNWFDNEKHKVIDKVSELNRLLLEKDIPLEVLVGQEVRIYDELVQDLANGELQTIHNTDYLLIELPFSSLPDNVEETFARVSAEGITPILAHPERYRSIYENPDFLYKLVENGALTQLTAGSVVGHFGEREKQFSKELLEARLTHFIASDAHDTVRRGFCLQEAYDLVQKEYGFDMYMMLLENSELVVENKLIDTLEPTKIIPR